MELANDSLSHVVSNVLGHLLNLSRVVTFDFLHHGGIVGDDKVDGNSLPSETTRATNAMEVVLLLLREVVVDDNGDLLDVNTTSKEIGGDEDTGLAIAELLHDGVALILTHISVQGRDGKVLTEEGLSELLDLAASVTEDDGLGDAQALVEISQGLELEGLLADVNVELLDTFQGQFVSLDHDADGIAHEAVAHRQDFLGHGGTDEDNLDVVGEALEDLIDLVLETTAQHFISLIQAEHLDGGSAENLAVNHVKDTSGSSDDDVDTVLEDAHVLGDGSTTNTSMDLDVHSLTNGHDDRLNLDSQLTSRSQDQGLGLELAQVNLLQDADGESGSLTSTTLGLGNNITVTDDGNDTALLNGRRALKTIKDKRINKLPYLPITVDTTEKFSLQIHIIEGLENLVIVGLIIQGLLIYGYDGG